MGDLLGVYASARLKGLKKNEGSNMQKQLVAELPDWVPLEAWEGWLEMRKAKKVPTTPRAQKLALAKLAEFRAQGMDPEKVIDQSTERGWTTFYALKVDASLVTEREAKSFRTGRDWAKGST